MDFDFITYVLGPAYVLLIDDDWDRMKWKRYFCLDKFLVGEGGRMEIKHDPVEETKEYRSIVDMVNKEAEALVDKNIRYGRSMFVEKEKQRILKEKYNIDWKTTDEMNPDWDFI